MSQSSVRESALERRFVGELERKVMASAGGSFEAAGEGAWKVGVGARRWLLRAQVALGVDRAAIPCRADFVLYPEEVGALPIAIFTDGLAFHVAPREKAARLADDARKRMGASQGGGMLTWSLSWKDVVTPSDPPVPRWTGDGGASGTLQGLLNAVDGAAPKPERLAQLLPVIDGDPLAGLLAMLEAPSRLQEVARVAAFSLLREGRASPRRRSRLTLRLEDGEEARARPDFEASWRLWLRAWNLLQVLPGAVLVTSEGAVAEAQLPSSPPPPPVATAARLRADDPRRVAAEEIGDATARAAVLELLERHPTLQAPKVPLEQRPEVDGDLELGWPEHRVAAFFDGQRATAEALKERGWTVLSIERGLDVATLEGALGLGDSRDSGPGDGQRKR